MSATLLNRKPVVERIERTYSVAKNAVMDTTFAASPPDGYELAGVVGVSWSAGIAPIVLHWKAESGSVRIVASNSAPNAAAQTNGKMYVDVLYLPA